MDLSHRPDGQRAYLLAMRRQAQDELALAIGSYTDTRDASATKLYDCSRPISAYVAHGFLSEREVRERFFDAARQKGDIARFDGAWAAKSLRSALNAGALDALPPLQSEYCEELAGA